LTARERRRIVRVANRLHDLGNERDQRFAPRSMLYRSMNAA
jgi:hypothetical protein